MGITDTTKNGKIGQSTGRGCVPKLGGMKEQMIHSDRVSNPTHGMR